MVENTEFLSLYSATKKRTITTPSTSLTNYKTVHLRPFVCFLNVICKF
jgi:hypothetical protein